jgi:hypothetical protein
MTFEHDESADVLWVSISEPSSLCVYVEGQTPGVILRIEESTGVVCGFQILVWSRRISKGPILIPEVTDTEFQEQWVKNLSLIRGNVIL